MKEFCSVNKFPYPAFIVIQAGTRVLETQNVGSFDSPVRVDNELLRNTHPKNDRNMQQIWYFYERA